MAVLRRHFSAAVLLDLTEASDMARPSQLFRGGASFGYQPRMMRMLLRMHHLPRRLKGYSTYSEPLQVDQGTLASCAHAVCTLEVLTLRATLRLREVHGNLVPRALVDAGCDSTGVKALQLA
eukprot:9149605-Pyramimonas_sp.AAC.1